MTKKEILRKIVLGFFSFWILYSTIKFALGKADILSTIMVCFFYFVMILYLIIIIRIKIYYHRLYKKLVKSFDYLKNIHETRNKLCLTGGNKEKIKQLSEIIKKQVPLIIETGIFLISNRKISQKEFEIICDIISKAEKLK